jgi:hypothetical protein
MEQRSSSTNGSLGARRALPDPRARNGGGSTADAIVAVARDTLDVATELVRDAVTLARLEAERSLRDVTPRIIWGGVAMVCAATASVCAIVAIMIGLGALVPSIAWRLVILAGALFLVAFFGSVRALRPEARMTSIPVTSKEEPISEGPGSDTLASRHTERLTNTILPPPND